MQAQKEARGAKVLTLINLEADIKLK